MVFSSMVFICVFLPIVFILYCVIPSLKLKNLLLVLASLIFYAYGEPVYIILMLFSSFINYIFGLFVGKENKSAKVFMILAVAVNIGLLAVFKYAGFFMENLNHITGLTLPVPQIELPIGISFFTFQALSYVIDVYRKQAGKQRNFGNILLYISFFPQLIAGPIVKYHDIDKEINSRCQTPEGVAKGIRRFIIGLCKKVIIANTMGITADYVFGLELSSVNIASAWIGAIAYALQIYYDFSGYSDMAIGLGEMFGFHFKENFLHPYSAESIKKFWRKWHISLSTWFKEYLYIPLGGNRKGKVRTGVNKIIVFFCTGLWHGASWNFVLWGLIHGLFSMLEETRFFPLQKVKTRWVHHFYTLVIVIVTFVLFRSETLQQGVALIGRMFTGFQFTAVTISAMWEPLTPKFLFLIVTAVLFAMPLLDILKQYLQNHKKAAALAEVISYPGTLILLLICILDLSSATFNPFIYFRF